MDHKVMKGTPRLGLKDNRAQLLQVEKNAHMQAKHTTSAAVPIRPWVVNSKEVEFIQPQVGDTEPILSKHNKKHTNTRPMA